MKKESEDRVRNLRAHIREERIMLADLESQFKDSYIRKLIQQATHYVDDVENLYLGLLGRESSAPATESMVIRSAELVFYQMAVPLRKQVQKILEDYGPDAIAIP